MANEGLDIAEALLPIARAAAAVVMEVYASAFTVELKSPGDPVTVADREANTLICARLSQAFPHAAIVAEESAPETAEALRACLDHDEVFFVDPLDGTKEFAARNGEFAVMIGLAIGGRARVGVVLRPTTGEAFVGDTETHTAFVETASGARSLLKVSRTTRLEDALLLTSRSHPGELLKPILDQLGIHRVRPCGSVGVKVSEIARGEADLYVHGKGGAKAWDSCAPEAILRAAGGAFTDLAGAPIDYRDQELRRITGMAATNGALHTLLIRAASQMRERW